MNDVQIDPMWGVVDEYTVEQAAAIIGGYDPGEIARRRGDANFQHEFPRLYPIHTAIVHAIGGGRLSAKLRYDATPDYVAGIDMYKERSYWRGEDVTTVADEKGEEFVINRTPNWQLSTIMVDDLRAWLSEKGMNSGFFFPVASAETPDFLDQNHPRFAPKLAAAVRAWRAVNYQGTTSAKRALEKWLKEHAAELGLVGNDGLPINQAIEECSKVANWQQKGGAPRTPAN